VRTADEVEDVVARDAMVTVIVGRTRCDLRPADDIRGLLD
jgi:hypothetical protein